MSEKFTPGPWRLSAAGTVMTVGGETRIADIIHSIRNPPDPAVAADGALIAAAPDMFAALVAQSQANDWLMARLIEKDETFLPSKSGVWPSVLQANAALSKARGETQ